MKLEKCYALPPVSFGPHKDFYPDAKKMPNLLYSWRLYPCRCGTVSGWRYISDNTPHIVCSTECLEAVIRDEIERAKGTPPEP